MYCAGCRIMQFITFGGFCVLLELVVVGFFSQTVDSHSVEEFPKLILISLDGFRWDYLDDIPETEVPHFTFFRKNGSWAVKGIENAFITKTLPNHETLVTGLFEESHGILSNEFYDPAFDEVYSISNAFQMVQSKWYDTGAEPIWVTNQKASDKRHSGSVMWPGCGSVQKGVLPSKYILFDQHVDFRTRIDILVSWFTLHHEPINLGVLYINEPDQTGHRHGPKSPELKDMIKKLDGDIGHLLNSLKKNDLWEEINIIITSDHGMASTPANKTINLDDYVPPNWYHIYTGNPVALIRPIKGKSRDVYEGFKKIPHLTVYWKEEIPEHYHYRRNGRVPEIVIVADLHYSLSYNRTNVTAASGKTLAGNHGYSNTYMEMHPIFMAIGPAFRKNTVETFSSTDVYPMMCYILDVEPAPNNGSLQRVMSLLQPKKSEGEITIAYFVLIPIVLCVAAILAVAAFRQRNGSRRRLLKIPGSYAYPSTILNSSLISSEEEEELID